MKLKKYFFILCGCTIFLFGCQSKNGKEGEVIEFNEVIPSATEPVLIRGTEVETESEETQSTIEAETEDEILICDNAQVSYEVELNTWESGNVKIVYPQIKNMEDQVLCDNINQSIKSVLNIEEIDSSEYTTYQIDTEIATKGNGILSLVFRGYLMGEGSAHPSQFISTLNIDMTTGKNVRLKDYADIENIVTCLETDTGYELISQEVTKEDVSAFLNNGYVTDYAMTLLDFDNDLSNQDSYVTGYSYIKDNRTVLCFTTEHAMGDYVEIKMLK